MIIERRGDNIVALRWAVGAQVSSATHSMLKKANETVWTAVMNWPGQRIVFAAARNGVRRRSKKARRNDDGVEPGRVGPGDCVLWRDYRTD